MTALNVVVLNCDWGPDPLHHGEHPGSMRVLAAKHCTAAFVGAAGEDLEQVRTASHAQGWRTVDGADLPAGVADYCGHHEWQIP